MRGRDKGTGARSERTQGDSERAGERGASERGASEREVSEGFARARGERTRSEGRACRLLFDVMVITSIRCSAFAFVTSGNVRFVFVYEAHSCRKQQ